MQELRVRGAQYERNQELNKQMATHPDDAFPNKMANVL